MSKIIMQDWVNEYNRINDKEQALIDTINEQNKQLVDNENQYKELLKAGKEKEADDLYRDQLKLKEENQLNHAKLKNLKPIHKDVLYEKSCELLDNDLPILSKKYQAKFADIIRKEKELERQKSELSDLESQLREEVNKEFSIYDQIAEEMEMRKKNRQRFYQYPYDVLSYAPSKLYEQARKEVEKNG